MLVMQPPREPPHATWRLTVAGEQDAVVLAPELVLREPVELCPLFDQEHEIGRDLFDVQFTWLNDRRHSLAGLALASAVDHVPIFDNRDRADNRATFVCPYMKLLA